MRTKDRSWFERKVRALGKVLRRLPRQRRRALIDVIETESTSSTYPEPPSCRVVVAGGPPKPGEGTYTPPAPYGVEPEAPHDTGGRLDDDRGERGLERADDL